MKRILALALGSIAWFLAAPLGTAAQGTNTTPSAAHADAAHTDAAHADAAHADAQQAAPAAARMLPWPRELVELAERLPVQEGGRVKPLLTHARYMLLRLNGKRSVTTSAGETLGPVEWMLDLFFFPEASEEYPVFLVADDQAIEAIGLHLEGKKKRDRYSFRELRPGIAKLFELARQYDGIEEKNRSSVQQQVFLLALNVDDYMKVLTHFDFARARLDLGPDAELRNVFGGAQAIGFGQLVAHAADLRQLQTRLSGAAQPNNTLRAVAGLMQAASELASGTEALTLFPPAAPVESESAWLSPAEIVQQASGWATSARGGIAHGVSPGGRDRQDPVAAHRQSRNRGSPRPLTAAHVSVRVETGGCARDWC